MTNRYCPFKMFKTLLMISPLYSQTCYIHSLSSLVWWQFYPTCSCHLNHSHILCFSHIPHLIHVEILLKPVVLYPESDFSHYPYYPTLNQATIIISCLDYCNSLLTSFPASALVPLCLFQAQLLEWYYYA